MQSSLGQRIFQKMEALEVKLHDILSCEEIPVIKLKFYAIDAFVKGYHVYNKTGPLPSEMSYRGAWNQEIKWTNM